MRVSHRAQHCAPTLSNAAHLGRHGGLGREEQGSGSLLELHTFADGTSGGKREVSLHSHETAAGECETEGPVVAIPGRAARRLAGVEFNLKA
jgi:hypothetical protein